MNNNLYEGLVCFDTPEKVSSNLEDIISNLSLNSPNKTREFGRWNIQECQIYLEVIKNSEGKDIIKQLKKAIPSRAESQIRAHHIKMMRKYKTIEEIILISDYKSNSRLLKLQNSKLAKLMAFECDLLVVYCFSHCTLKEHISPVIFVKT